MPLAWSCDRTTSACWPPWPSSPLSSGDGRKPSIWQNSPQLWTLRRLSLLSLRTAGRRSAIFLAPRQRALAWDVIFERRLPPIVNEIDQRAIVTRLVGTVHRHTLKISTKAV